MDPEFNVFVRSFKGKKSIRIRPNLFQHTRVNYYKDYNFGNGGRKDCLMLAIGDGTIFFMYYALQEEIRMYVVWDGDVRYMEEDNSLVFDGGSGKVAFISAVPGEIEKHLDFYFSGADIEKRSRDFFR